MTQSEDDLKILLLQIRADDATKLEEYYEFVDLSGLRPEQISVLNSFETPSFEQDVIKGYDALFVGGSSDATVLKPDTYPFIPSCTALIRYCYDNHIPTFASCFGFQLAAMELGGKVILDVDNMEMGTFEISLTDAAKDDLLFHDTPSPFWAVSGHKERASQIGEDFIILAHSPLCPYHAFKIKDKPFYGFQFHPEVTKTDLISRITRYQARYLDGIEALQQIIAGLKHETPESNILVRKFVDRVLLGTKPST